MKSKKIVLLSVLSSLFLALQSFADIQVLMKLEGVDIPKEFSTKSQIAEFSDGYISILGASSGYGVSVSDLGTSQRSVGRPNYSEFSIIKLVDEITPVLTLNGVTGTPISKVIVVWVGNSGTQPGGAVKLMEFTMENVIVSGGAISGSQGEEQGSESVSLVWEKMTIQSYTRDSKGGVTPGPKVVIDAAKATASS